MYDYIKGITNSVFPALFRGFYARPAILKAEKALGTKLTLTWQSCVTSSNSRHLRCSKKGLHGVSQEPRVAAFLFGSWRHGIWHRFALEKNQSLEWLQELKEALCSLLCLLSLTGLKKERIRGFRHCPDVTKCLYLLRAVVNWLS